MVKPPSGRHRFQAALWIGWIALGAAGIGYARIKGIPNWAALPVLAAFLVTYPFYLVPAFPSLRERLAGLPLPGYLVAAAVLPYLMCCCGAVQFQWAGLAKLVAVALAFALWYVVLPAKPGVDIAFLALIPAVLLGKYFSTIYVPIYPPLKDVIVLGHISLIEIVVMVLLLVRRVDAAGYGFVPSRREWRIGALHFLYFVPIGLPLALALKAVHLVAPAPLWKIAGTFLGFLWVLALSEEFFFRGVLQQWIEEWTRSRTGALALTSCLFGLVHLGFGGRFPNWPWVLVAALLGWFCGRARNQAGSIRAGMVTHALVVTAWRAFFA
jgi:membrane protease YdiL (CAAX protease family)